MAHPVEDVIDSAAAPQTHSKPAAGCGRPVHTHPDHEPCLLLLRGAQLCLFLMTTPDQKATAQGRAVLWLCGGTSSIRNHCTCGRVALWRDVLDWRPLHMWPFGHGGTCLTGVHCTWLEWGCCRSPSRPHTPFPARSLCAGHSLS